ncbi:MAG TPA: hypothetical protein VF278_21610 [Pirellulales bacterium]
MRVLALNHGDGQTSYEVCYGPMNHPGWAFWRSLQTWTLALAMLACAAVLGCTRPPPEQPAGNQLPPAYASRHFDDPDVRALADQIEAQALKPIIRDGRKLFSRVEVLPPVPTVQPYGVGLFQQEVRLPVILTTGPGWSALTAKQKEAQVARDFNEFSAILLGLKRDPPLRPTLTVQTPEGMELTWMNRLDPSGKNVHGDE